jgi:hypothetical protein
MVGFGLYIRPDIFMSTSFYMGLLYTLLYTRVYRQNLFSMSSNKLKIGFYIYIEITMGKYLTAVKLSVCITKVTTKMYIRVPRVQVKRRPSAASRTHSDGPVSQTCLHRL